MSEWTEARKKYVQVVKGRHVPYNKVEDYWSFFQKGVNFGRSENKAIIKELLDIMDGVVVTGGWTLKNMERIAELRKEYGE